MLGYKDRSASLDPAHARFVVPGNNGVFMPTIVSNGRVAGTWRAVTTKRGVTLSPQPFAALGTRENRALLAAAARYERFVLGEG